MSFGDAQRLIVTVGARLIKTKGERRMYTHSGGTRFVVWEPAPGGVKLLEYDQQCDCPGF